MISKKYVRLFAVLALVAVTGFATGINYKQMAGNTIFSVGKGCFEFGLLYLFAGKTLKKCIFGALVSSFESFAVMCAGALSWLTFLLMPLELFGISFKMGVSFACVALPFSTIKLPSAFPMLLFVLTVMFAFVLLASAVTERRVYHSRKRKLDSTDADFIKYLAAGFIIFFLINVVFIMFSHVTNIGLKGFFGTVL